MLDGKIEGNMVNSRSSNLGKAVGGAGVSVWNSYFHLSGGVIRNNSGHADAPSNWYESYGGGVFIMADSSNTGTFVMDGGVISGNRLSSSVATNSISLGCALGTHGGGVGLHERSGGSVIMTKTGGIIYGNDVDGNDADGYPLKNMAQSDSGGIGGGHAVFYEVNLSSTRYRRNATAYATNNMDKSKSGAAGGWE
jgi:hypothetical protein